MRACPYCLQCFSTKQRLVSHLTKNSKCYDVEKIGVPPILLELMGFSFHPILPPMINNQELENIKAKSEKHSEQKTEESNQIKIKRTTEFQCQYCERYFINQKNLERHTVTNKCPKMKKNPFVPVANNPIVPVANDSIVLVAKNPIVTKSIPTGNIPVGTLSQRVPQDSQEIQSPLNDNVEDPMYRPKNAKRVNILPKKNMKMKNSLPHEEKISNRQSNIKYIIKEDYTDYLETIYNSREDALKYIKSCTQAKLRGDINLLYKIYFENKENKNYPIEVLDARGKKLYYKMPNNIILDENGSTVKSLLADNLQNCYLKFCNHIINSNMDDNDVLFNDYDLNDIQKHVLELSDEKIKDKLLIGLIELIKK